MIYTHVAGNCLRDVRRKFHPRPRLNLHEKVMGQKV